MKTREEAREILKKHLGKTLFGLRQPGGKDKILDAMMEFASDVPNAISISPESSPPDKKGNGCC